MKSPKMPDNLPPLPMGNNGKPLVYLGTGCTFKARCNTDGLRGEVRGVWDHSIWAGKEQGRHYAAPSDSEICRLNGWGDFEQPETPATMLELYRKAAKDALAEAEKMAFEAESVASSWRQRRTDCAATVSQLERQPEDMTNALERKSWYDQGRKDERHHSRIRTTFPAMPD